MTDQLSFFRPDGKALKARGARRVLDNSGEWKERAAALLREFVSFRHEFTSDDFRAFAGRRGLHDPHHVNGWGALITKAAKEKIILPTGRFVKSTRPDAHARNVSVWRSNV